MFSKFFSQSSPTDKLIQHVLEANYDQAKKSININPEVMFQEVQMDDNSITPLKLAFKQLDTYMWKLFLQKIQDNPEMVARFYNQAKEQAEHLVDLKSLFTAYDKYDEVHTIWLSDMHDVGVKNQLNAKWIAIGRIQREDLPRHMLKEFCRKGRSWSPESTFDINILPDIDKPTVEIRSHWNNAYIEVNILHFKPNKGLGFDHTLYRGAFNEVVFGYEQGANIAKDGCFGPVGGLNRHWRFDKDTFQRLYDVRRDDLIKQVSQLECLQKQNNGVSAAP